MYVAGQHDSVQRVILKGWNKVLTDKLRFYFPDSSRVLVSDRIPLKSREVPYIHYGGKLYVDDRIKMYNHEIPWVALTDSFYRAKHRRLFYDIRYVPFFRFLSNTPCNRIEGIGFLPVDLSDVAFKESIEDETNETLTQTTWVDAKQYNSVYIVSASYRMYTLSSRIIDLLRFVNEVSVLKYVYRKGGDYQQLVELAPLFQYQIIEEGSFITITRACSLLTYINTFNNLEREIDLQSYVDQQILGDYTVASTTLSNFFQTEVFYND